MREKFEDYVGRTIGRLIATLKLEHHKVIISYVDADEDGESGGFVAADISILTDYFSSKLRIYPEMRRQYDAGDSIFDMLLHEMCHHFSRQLYEYARGAMPISAKGFIDTIHEQETQRLTNVITALLADDEKEPREVEEQNGETKSEHGQSKETKVKAPIGFHASCGNCYDSENCEACREWIKWRFEEKETSRQDERLV
jgi:hypothetical protein